MADVWFYPLWPLAVADSELLQSAKAPHQLLALGNPGCLLSFILLKQSLILPSFPPGSLFQGHRQKNVFTQPQSPAVQCNLKAQSEKANVKVFVVFF